MKETSFNTAPSKTIFYFMESAIKSYRRFAQSKISMIHEDLTVDQALILQFLHHENNIPQVELAKLLFKKEASITRMVDALVQKNYLTRSSDNTDRRKFRLELTKKGTSSMEEIGAVVTSNRKKALSGISKSQQEILEQLLKKIIDNCQK